MEIIRRSVKELIPYDNNPRDNSKAVSYVANSIKEFGFKIPIVVDKNNVIVAGHTRLMAAEKLGMEEVPVIVADDLTEEQINAFRLVDNKSSEFSEWDLSKLEEELSNIEMDMSEFGFFEEEEIPLDRYDEEDSEKNVNQKFIKVGKLQIPITDEEEEMLIEKANEYSEENGLLYGFVRSLCE